MKKSFKAIEFGYASAETESTEAPQLLIDAFLDQFVAIDKLINGKKMLVLGEKGSGKSAIGERIRLLSSDKHNLFVNLKHLSTFPFKQFSKIVPGKEESSVRYPQAWEWLILISIFSSYIKDEGALENIGSDFKDFSKILKENKILPAGDFKQLVSKSSRKSFKIKVPIPLASFAGAHIEGGMIHDTAKEELFDIPVFLDLLREMVHMFKSKSRHIMVIDGLDDMLAMGEVQREVLSALIHSVHSINQDLHRNGAPAHIAVLCRTDIFECLPNPNKNKIKQDWAITLNWYQNPQNPFQSGLIKLAKMRAEKSLNTKDDFFMKFFPSDLDGRDTRKCLLDLTRHIPRDFLQLLSHIQSATEEDEEDLEISRNELNAGMRAYSLEYLLPEIKDCLVGFFSPEVIEMGISLVGSMRKKEFSLTEFLRHIEDNLGDENKENFNARKFLRALFHVGAIGNKTDQKTNPLYTFKFRNPNASINFADKICIHRGLWKAWNL